MKLESCVQNSSSNNCVWREIFNDEDRILLQDGFLITGLVSVIFSAWLSVTLQFTSIRFIRSYRNLSNFTLVGCIRRAGPLLLYLPLVKWIETWHRFNTISCEFFAFLETFLAVFEVECLTHVCIERYVLAKYVTNGWKVNKNHYKLYFCISLFFSCLYSMPPLFGVGRYAFAFHCTSCTFDTILPNTWEKYAVVGIFVLRTVKSAVFMILMLVWASVLENKLPLAMKHHQQFTQSAILITLVNLLCWTPMDIIRGSVIVSQLADLDWMSITSSCCITWAKWINWAAPAVTFIALFLSDDRVRYELINLNTRERKDRIAVKKEE